MKARILVETLRRRVRRRGAAEPLLSARCGYDRTRSAPVERDGTCHGADGLTGGSEQVTPPFRLREAVLKAVRETPQAPAYSGPPASIRPPEASVRE